MLSLLKKYIPDDIKNRYRKWFPKRKKHGWFGNYKSWNEAKEKCTGYNDSLILEKVKQSILKVKSGESVYERDSVLFDEIQLSEPLLKALKSIAAENDNTLHVVDFGGSLGSTYFQNREQLNALKDLKWSVVEQQHFVDCGKECVEDNQLKFFYTVEDALHGAAANVLLLSSVIQYFEKPYELIDKMIKYHFKYIVIDRTAFIKSEEDRITVQIVPEEIYKASYPAWFFNKEKFIKSFSKDYSLLTEFDSKFDPEELLDDNVESYRRGFVFKRKI